MSDNMLAEALARQVALARDLPASFEGSAKAVTGALTDAGVDITGVTLSDGSGLSRDDRVPAAVLTAVVRGAADGSLDGASALLSGLPGRRVTTARCSTAATPTRPPPRARCAPRPARCWASTRWPARR